MNEYFEINRRDAERFGLRPALILEEVRKRLAANFDNGEEVHEGKVWVRLTADEFADELGLYTAAQVRYDLHKLQDAGVLITNKFPRHQFDKTLSYTVNTEDQS